MPDRSPSTSSNLLSAISNTVSNFNGNLQVSGTGGGRIFVRGGQLTLDGGKILNVILGATGGGFIDESVLRLAQVPTPEPGPGELRLRVEGCAVNRADLLQRQGHYPPPPGASPILGLECAGMAKDERERDIRADPPGRGGVSRPRSPAFGDCGRWRRETTHPRPSQVLEVGTG